MPEALVRAGLVTVAEELAKDALEVTGTEDENVVQKLPSHRAHPALGKSIGPWSPEGKPDNPNVCRYAPPRHLNQAASSYSWFSPPSRSLRTI